MARGHQENLQKHQRYANKEWLYEIFSPFFVVPFLLHHNNYLMASKASLAIILAVMLLANPLHCLNWQGTGSGMNNTVISEIWNGITPNLNTAFSTNSNEGFQAFAKEISDRLNSRWDPAWNVVIAMCRAQYDIILYGYAFKDQWMWYNGVPNSRNIFATLIVWKDYNCRDWKGVRDASAFTTTQKTTIRTIVTSLTEPQLRTDVWGAAVSMMTNIIADPEFSSGGYSVIMSQDGTGSDFHGYVCRVADKHYNYFMQNSVAITPSGYGDFYLFQTR